MNFVNYNMLGNYPEFCKEQLLLYTCPADPAENHQGSFDTIEAPYHAQLDVISNRRPVWNRINSKDIDEYVSRSRKPNKLQD